MRKAGGIYHAELVRSAEFRLIKFVLEGVGLGIPLEPSASQNTPSGRLFVGPWFH